MSEREKETECMKERQTTKAPAHVGDLVDGERVAEHRARETQEVGLPLGCHHLGVLVLHAERNKVVAHIRWTQVRAQSLSEELQRQQQRENEKGGMKEKTKRATNKEETLDNALQRRRCNAVLLCEGVKGRKEIGHLLSENTNDKVDKLGKLLVAQRVQLLDVAVQLLVRGCSTASEVKLWHPEDGKERRKEED